MFTARTRIIATLGPASARTAVLPRLVAAGLDVVRINCSHGTHAEYRRAIRLVRRLNRRARSKVEILLDLEGPRIRIGDLRKPILLEKNAVFWLTRGGTSGKNRVPLDYTGPFDGIRSARHIFIDDGNLALEILGVEKNRIRTRVIVGGLLKQHKGVNIPGARLEFPLLSDNDRDNVLFGIHEQVDWIAQSFVRSAKEMEAVTRLARPHLPRARFIAKIETRDGIRNVDEILDVADGIMVARGDLGVTLPIWEVPMRQKELIARARARGKIVITATQMIESMCEHPRPTRAEVSDIANAVIDGTDYVMLSAESAVGKYPVEAVDMMNKICFFTEKALAAGAQKKGRRR